MPRAPTKAEANASLLVASRSLNYLLATVRCLRRVVGIAFLSQMLDAVASIASLSQEMLLRKLLLQLLAAIVDEPTKAFLPLLPKIVEIGYAAYSNAKSDALAFFDFFRVLLVQQWRWFVASSMVPDARGKREKRFASEVSKLHFYRVMEALLGGIETKPRVVLATLQELNRRHDLYRLPAFAADMRPAFAQKMLAAVIGRTFPTLVEDIIDALVDLASADFADFFKRSVATVVADPGVSEALAASSGDRPSFAKALCAFCDDARIIASKRG